MRSSERYTPTPEFMESSLGVPVETVVINAARGLSNVRRELLPYNDRTNDLNVLQERSARLSHTLESKLQAEIPAHTRRAAMMRDAIAAGDLEAQAAQGIDLREVRFDTLAQAIILGQPIEYQTATSASRLGPRFKDRIKDATEMHDTDTTTSQIHRALRELVVSGGSHLRTNSLVVYDPEYTPIAIATNRLADTVRAMRRQGALQPTDIIGRDLYVKLLGQDDITQLEPLLKALGDSPYGAVIKAPERPGSSVESALTTFMPHPQYIGYAAHLTGTSSRYIQKVGLPLYLPGMAMDTALLAADSLTKDESALRLSIEDTDRGNPGRQANALTRLAGSVGMEVVQTIHHNGSRIVGAWIDAAIARALLPHVYQFQRNLGRFGSPVDYKAREYFEHNYGAGVKREQELLNLEPIIPGMLNEDYYCRTAVIRELHDRFYGRRFTTMYDVYCGPGTSLARIMAPYIRDKEDGGSITLIDLSPSSIEFQQQWIDGTLDPADAAVAKLDQQLFDQSPLWSFYRQYTEHGVRTADDQARRLAGAQLGDFDHLEPASCDVLTDGYGTCSSGRPLINGEVDPVPPTYADFCRKQKQKYTILRPGGVTVSMHMVRRTNWNGITEDTQQPIELSSVYLASGAEIEQAYMDAGFVNVFCKIITVDTPHHANIGAETSGGDQTEPSSVAMAVVIAEKPDVQGKHDQSAALSPGGA